MTASEWAKTIQVWEAHRCPRCFRKWAKEAPEGGSGKSILLMCPPCTDEIRCPHKEEHPSNCHCNFTRPEDQHA